MELISNFADRLKEALNLRQMKANQLADLSRINKSTISQYLNKVYEPKRARIELFARILNVDEAWLIGYDVSHERKNNNFLALNAKERKQYDSFMNEATLYFNDEKISIEDKQKVFDSLQDVFWEIKMANKRKK